MEESTKLFSFFRNISKGIFFGRLNKKCVKPVIFMVLKLGLVHEHKWLKKKTAPPKKTKKHPPEVFFQMIETKSSGKMNRNLITHQRSQGNAKYGHLFVE